MKFKLLLAAVIVAAFAAGITIFILLAPGKATTVTLKSISTVGQQRPEYSLKDIDDKDRHAREWDGKVVLVNFWATWCPPCRKEIPAFIELHEKYQAQGFEIVGIALDTRQAAIDFVDPMGINYPILIGDLEGIDLSQRYGNRNSVMPYTVIIDRKGVIRHAHAGELTLHEAESLIKPLL